MAAILVNAACTTPPGRAPPRGQPAGPRQATPAIVDEGPVRLEPFGDALIFRPKEWKRLIVASDIKDAFDRENVIGAIYFEV